MIEQNKPIVKIGKFEISMMIDNKGKNRIWIWLEDGEGGEFSAVLLEPYIEEFFNKYF